MPLAPTAPWIIPPDYTGAMARGAQLGLSARNQDREEKSAADRLKLAYDQLDRHEQIASANAAEKLAFETKKLDLMGEYNKQRLEAQAEKNKPTAIADPIIKDVDGHKFYLMGDNWHPITGGSTPMVTLKTDPFSGETTADEKVPLEQWSAYKKLVQNPGTTTNEVPFKKGWFSDTPAHQVITTNIPPTWQQFHATNQPSASRVSAPAAAALTAQAASGMALPTTPAPLPQGPGIPPGPFQTPAQNIPDAPIDKSQRKIGQVYKTPKGLHQWTEAGWIKQASSDSNEER